MDNKDSQIVSIRVTAAELSELDTRAAQKGITRAEFVRSKLFADDTSTSLDSIHLLLERLIGMTNQVHSATYAIAEREGQLNRFLSTSELDAIDQRVREQTIEYMKAAREASGK